jgi:ABC-type branched-subunit amino acid transport system ATPase component
MTITVTSAPTVLSATDVSVHFGGLKALQNVSVSVPEATIIGLLGPNGAGKSTLLGVLSGDVPAASGTVALAGETITTIAPQARVRRGLARTFQQPEIFGELTVREHLVLASRLARRPSRAWTDPFTGRFLRSDPQGDVEVAALLEDLELTAVADVPVGALPLGVSRLVEIGRATATQPRVVLLDEPFSGLNPAECHALTRTLGRIRETNGIAMVLVEHDVEVVFGLSSHVYVLDFGVLIAEGSPAEIQNDRTVRAAYLGDIERGHTTATSRVDTPGSAGPAATARRPQGAVDTLLEVESLCVQYGTAVAVQDVSMAVPKGAVTALLGANGAGKSTLARSIAGLVPASGGRVTFDGHDITHNSAHEIRRLGLAYLPEGRGIFRSLTVIENLRVAVATLPKQQRAVAIERAIDFFPVLGERRRQIAGTLSGGQQQMLSLARVMADMPRLVVADEISLGLAPLVVDEVFEGLQRAIELDVAVVLIEQFVHRALSLAKDCYILRRGRVVWQGRAADAGAEVVDHYLGAVGTGLDVVHETEPLQ